MKKNISEQKQTSFRTWKSGKRWYSSAALTLTLLSMGGGVLAQHPVCASTQKEVQTQKADFLSEAKKEHAKVETEADGSIKTIAQSRQVGSSYMLSPDVDEVPVYGSVMSTKETALVTNVKSAQEQGIALEQTWDPNLVFFNVKAGDSFRYTNVSKDAHGNKVDLVRTVKSFPNEHGAAADKRINGLAKGQKNAILITAASSYAESKDGTKYMRQTNGLDTATVKGDPEYDEKFVISGTDTPATDVSGYYAVTDLDVLQAVKSSEFGKNDIVQIHDDKTTNSVSQNKSKETVYADFSNGVLNVGTGETYGGVATDFGAGFAQPHNKFKGNELTMQHLSQGDQSLYAEKWTEPLKYEKDVFNKTITPKENWDLGESHIEDPTAVAGSKQIVEYGIIDQNFVPPQVPTAPTLNLKDYTPYPEFTPVSSANDPVKKVLDDKGQDVDGKELPNDASFTWEIAQEILGNSDEYSQYQDWAKQVSDIKVKNDQIEADNKKAVSDYEASYKVYSESEYPAYKADCEGGGVTPEAMAEKEDTTLADQPTTPSTKLEDNLYTGMTIEDTIDLTKVNLQDVDKYSVEVYDKDGKKLDNLTDKQVKITRADKDGKATIKADFAKDYVQSDDFYGKTYKLILPGDTFIVEQTDKEETVDVPNTATVTVVDPDDAPDNQDTNTVDVKTKVSPEAIAPLAHTGKGMSQGLIGLALSALGVVLALAILGYKKFKKQN